MLCLVVIMALVSTHRQNDAGLQSKAEFAMTAAWSIDDSDVDVDLWAIGPPKQKPVFYGNREAGLLSLDQDCLGYPNMVVTMPDGSYIRAKECKEITSLRGLVPGHYDLGLHLYRAALPGRAEPLGIKVHVEILKLNPKIQIMFMADLVLDRVKQTINFASFDINASGVYSMAQPPVEPITDAYYKSKE